MKIQTILVISPLAALWLAPVAVADEPRPPSAAVADPDAVVSEDDHDDPFANSSPMGGSDLVKIPHPRLGEQRETLNLRVEVWELESKAMVVRLDQLDAKDAVADWRRELLKSTARLVHAPLLSLEAKSRATVEATVERIYPTEYEPPEVLPEAALQPLLELDDDRSLADVIETLTTSATPTAFETRNTGMSLEAEVHPVAAEKGCWDLSIAFADIKQVGMENYGDDKLHLQMPVFTSFQAGGLLRVEGERWQLLSSAPAPQIPDQAASGNSWVVFLRIDPAR